MADILSDFESIAGRLISPDIAVKVAAELRRRYGGDRVYISAIDREARTRKIIARLQQGAVSRVIAGQVGCSSSTVLRVKNRGAGMSG